MKTSTAAIWNCLSTKITYMEIWKTWLLRLISYCTSSEPRRNGKMTLSPALLSLASPEQIALLRARPHSQCSPTEKAPRSTSHTPTQAYPHKARSTRLSGPSITHLFPGWWWTRRWRQARSPPWYRSTGRTCIYSKAPNHAGSTWWSQVC